MRHGELKHIFDILERSFNQLNIDFYLIGALARQVWYEKGNMSFRTTKDVDYAVLVSNQDEYQRIRAYLIDTEKFTPYSGNAFVLIAPDGTQVDILPFGEIEDDGSVTVNGQGMTSIRVDGLIDVYNNGVEDVEFETGHSFKVATLPAIALLKFIAYDDRPEHRQKDATDISNLVVHFFTLNDEMIYQHHNDLFDETKNIVFESIGAIVLGREMRKIASSNEGLVIRLNNILEKHIQKEENSAFVRLMVNPLNDDSTIESVVKALKDIYKGFNNSI
ncbi:nucleotidyl transferase AbiEii/AbiGii toxin family protein [Sphingobacterium hotanense]|uniref:Nucleotidyl transferase AbiEii/AbiGii toxin family protein n=1 Tax=Sphingobacterium hotanense TaxID=649196 RepID=A0ABT7NHW5_9SPHI|nr:nucleotidyl transferase AbiEii/AbiGii toxin family protein [Sphingobacterium hotanense]MDM1046778.1 nucleotidyl transferase AbiEii/AbiGii toxin family protein [Sphingobacterium hotanense]